MLGQLWTRAFTPLSVKLELSLRLTDRRVFDEIELRPLPVMCFSFLSFNSSTVLKTKKSAAIPLSGGIAKKVIISELLHQASIGKYTENILSCKDSCKIVYIPIPLTSCTEFR